MEKCQNLNIIILEIQIHFDYVRKNYFIKNIG